MTYLRAHAWWLLCGLSVILAFPPISLYPLIWLSIFFLLKHLETLASAKQAFKHGIALGLFISLGTYYWIAYTLHQFAGLPWAVSILALLLFCAICQFQMALFSAFAFRALQAQRRLPLPRALFWALLGCSYAAIDWLTPKLFHDTFSQALSADPIHRQAAEAVGIFGLSALIATVGGLLIDATRNPLAPGKKPPRWNLKAPILAVLPFTVFGLVRFLQVSEWERQSERPPARFAVIQANIGDFEKLASEQGVRGAADGVVNKYLSMSSEAVESKPETDFVVWPETAYPSTFGTPGSFDEAKRDYQIHAWAKDYQRPLIFGGYDTKDRKDYNSVFFLSPDARSAASGTKLDVYHKHVLLTFGETIPFADTFPWILKQFPQVGQFGRGPGAQAFTVQARDGKDVNIAPAICYEALIDWFFTDGAKLSPHLFLNVTNDSWYGATSEPSMHLALASFRSIETRIPMLRATNTGYTALVYPSGKIENPSHLFRPETLDFEVMLREPNIQTLRIYAGLRKLALVLVFAGALFLGFRTYRLGQNTAHP